MLDGHLVLARLIGHHPEKMNCVSLVRIDGENLPVELLGGLSTAGLMMLDGDR